jgi:integrase
MKKVKCGGCVLKTTPRPGWIVAERKWATVISPGNIGAVWRYVRKYLIPGFQGHSIADLRTHHIEDFLSKTLPKDLKPKTKANIIAVLRKMLRDAHRRQEIGLVPAVPSVKQDDHQIRWLWEQEQELILAKIDDPVRRIFFLFMMRQGLRPGEARALQWDRIDLYREVEIGPGRTIKGVVTINAAMDQDTFRPRTKTGRIRVLPLHPEVREALLQIPGREGYVFQFRNKPFNRKMVDKTWRRAAKAAGFEGVTCYQGTRHSAASQAINSGCDLKTIKDFLGHADLRTNNRYAHLLTGTLAKVWDRPQGAETPPEPPKPAKVIELRSRRKVTG